MIGKKWTILCCLNNLINAISLYCFTIKVLFEDVLYHIYNPDNFSQSLKEAPRFNNSNMTQILEQDEKFELTSSNIPFKLIMLELCFNLLYLFVITSLKIDTSSWQYMTKNIKINCRMIQKIIQPLFFLILVTYMLYFASTHGSEVTLTDCKRIYSRTTYNVSLLNLLENYSGGKVHRSSVK